MTRALSRVLGLDPSETAVLGRLARERLGYAGYTVRVVLLLIAASRPGRLLPRALRLRVIRPLVFSLLWGPAENLVYVRRSA